MNEALTRQRLEVLKIRNHSESPNQSGNQCARSLEAEFYRIPESLGVEWWIALGIFVISVLYLGLFRNYLTLNPDEGVSLQGAQRVLQGQVLYRDFFAFFTPGSYYWDALLFKVFGSTILVPRTALMVYGGLFSALTYLLARRVCARWAALLASCCVTLVCLPYRFLVLHNWDSTVVGYLALYCSIRLLEAPHWRWGLSAGCLASLTCLFEQSKGAGLLLGLVVGFGAIVALHRSRELKFRHLAHFLVGFAIPAAITVAYFASKQSLHLMLADCLWAWNHYSLTNTTPYGYLELSTTGLQGLLGMPWTARFLTLFVMSPFFVIPALPIIALGPLCYGLVILKRNKELESVASYYVVISATLLGLLLSTLATGRADLHHLLYQAPLFMLVLAWAMDGVGVWPRGRVFLRPFLVLFVALSFTALGMAIVMDPFRAHTVIPTRRGSLKAVRPDPVLRALEKSVAPGRTVFVYPYQPMYYYLTSTNNPTPFEYLQIGEHTSEEFEKAMADVASDRTEVVVFQLSFMDEIPTTWPSTPIELLAARDRGADFILRHYRPCESMTSMQNWNFVFFVRNDLNCARVLRH